MKTRRSPRNQERLFRYLFKSKDSKPTTPRIYTLDEIAAMWWLTKTSRNILIRKAEKEIARAKVRAALAEEQPC